MRRFLSWVRPGLALVAVMAPACAPSVRVRPQIDQLSPSMRVLAVGPMKNLVPSPAAASAMTAVLVNELRQRDRFSIMEADQLTETDRWSCARAGRALGADLVLVGEVTAFGYEEGDKSAVPTLGLNVRVIATATADVVWAAGVDANDVRLLSYDSMPLLELSQRMAAALADELAGAR